MNKLNKALLSKFDTIEKQREAIYAALESIDEKTLHLKPAIDKWSIIQIIFHLVKAEHISIISIQNNLLKNKNTSNAGMSSRIRAVVLNYALRTPLKFKAPKILGNMPDSYNLNELKKKWIKLRCDLKAILKNIKPEDAKRNLFRHPYAGDVSIFQALDFIREHFLHHNKQIERIRNKAKNNS